MRPPILVPESQAQGNNTYQSTLREVSAFRWVSGQNEVIARRKHQIVEVTCACDTIRGAGVRGRFVQHLEMCQCNNTGSLLPNDCHQAMSESSTARE